jgi:TATA-binding protein-associated factor Taf7
MNLESRISEFSELERELDETLRKLKAARDPKLRREVLRKLRRLLADADRILDSSIES